MKKFLITLMVLTISLLQVSVSAAVLPEKTNIIVKPKKMINADHVKEGSTVYFETVHPVTINDEIVIKPGTKVTAKVNQKKNNFIFGIPGMIEVGSFELHMSHNVIVPLQGIIEQDGTSRRWVNWGLLFLPPMIFIKGEDGKIPTSHTIDLYTLEPIEY